MRKFLEEWQQKYRESEERYRAERDEAFRSDDKAARAEEQLAAEKAAELKRRTKVVEQRLPIIAAGLGILWSEVTGSSRPVPSEIRLISTGNTLRGKSGQDDSGRSQGQGFLPRRQTDMWCFPAFSKDKELVWLRATRSQHVSVTRITHQAAVRLGLTQSVTEAYQVQLRLSSESQKGSRRWSASDQGASGEARELFSRM
jgi:hypothetical protein